MAISPRLMTVFSPLVIVGTASFVAGIAATYVFITFKQLPKNDYATAAYGQVSESVQAKGTVAITGAIDLGFERGGVIQTISVGPGSKVASKQPLASIATGDLTQQLSLAKDDLAVGKTKLAALTAGPSPDELTALRKSLAGELGAGYQTGVSATGVVNQFISQGATPALSFQTSDSALAQSVIVEWQQMEQLLSNWKTELPDDSVAGSSTVLLARTTAAEAHLSAADTFLNDAGAALARAITTPDVPAAALLQYQNSIASARLSIADGLTALTAAAGKLSIAEAPTSTAPEVQAQNAAIVAAQAKVDSLTEQLKETQLIAPIDGTIIQQMHAPGDAVAAGDPVFVFSSKAHYQISANISPQDAGKIHAGQDATVLLDAYSGHVWPAKIVSITPSKIIAQFIVDNPILKPGVAGTISILNAAQHTALLVPEDAIVVRGGSSYVLKLAQGASGGVGGTKPQDVLVPVQTGITTTDRNVEIISGLASGDKIRTSVGIY